jgi:hypothetical protein
MIEATSKKEMKKLGDEIRAKCKKLDVNIQKLRNPQISLDQHP